MKKPLLLAPIVMGICGFSWAAEGPVPSANLEIFRIDPAVLKTVPAKDAESSDNFKILAGKPKIIDVEAWKSSDGAFTAGAASLGVVTLALKDFSVDQYMTLLSGKVEVTDNNGRTQKFGPGDSLIIPRGFAGTWKNLSPIRIIAIHHYTDRPMANPEITRVDPGALKTAPETDAENTDDLKIVAGKPKNSFAQIYKSADGRFTAGPSTLGTATATLTNFKVNQFMTLLAGEVEVTDKNGKIQKFGPGDSFVIPKGFSGTWKDLSPIRFQAVMYDPTAQ